MEAGQRLAHVVSGGQPCGVAAVPCSIPDNRSSDRCWCTRPRTPQQVDQDRRAVPPRVRPRSTRCPHGRGYRHDRWHCSQSRCGHRRRGRGSGRGQQPAVACTWPTCSPESCTTDWTGSARRRSRSGSACVGCARQAPRKTLSSPKLATGRSAPSTRGPSRSSCTNTGTGVTTRGTRVAMPDRS